MMLRKFMLCMMCVFATHAANSQVTVIPSTVRKVVDGKVFYLHTVKQGETLYSISKAYNISQKEIETYNTDAVEGIKTGQQVLVPDNTVYKIHSVVRGENLFSISRSYNASINDILDVNREIDPKDPKLSIGQQIRIPIANDENTSQSSQPQCQPIDEIKPAGKCKREMQIAMLLPLYISDNFSTTDTSMRKDNEVGLKYKDSKYFIQPRSMNALEFYHGALIAIDSLRKQGLNAKVYIYDTMRNAERVEQILENPEMKNSDLIIGPFNTDMVDKVRDFTRENGIYCVTPTAISAESLKNNPFLLQVNIGEINTVNKIVKYIATQKNIHITLIGNTRESDKTIFNAYRNKLKSVFSDSMYTVKQMRLDSLQQPVRYLNKNMMNVVIIPSSDESFINIVAGQLNSASNTYQVNVYGLMSWTKFVNFDLEYLHALEFRYASSYNIDYERPEVKNFIRQYKKEFFTEPTMVTSLGKISPYPYQIAFLGYDVTFFFMSALIQFGENFGDKISDFKMKLLQSDFHFERVDSLSGFRNTHLDIYRYSKEYDIVKED